jgi:hypothetical protein
LQAIGNQSSEVLKTIFESNGEDQILFTEIYYFLKWLKSGAVSGHGAKKRKVPEILPDYCFLSGAKKNPETLKVQCLQRKTTLKKKMNRKSEMPFKLLKKDTPEKREKVRSFFPGFLN